MSEIIKKLEKIHCTLNKKHELRVKSLKGKKFVLWCPDCKEELGITNELKGTIN